MAHFLHKDRLGEKMNLICRNAILVAFCAVMILLSSSAFCSRSEFLRPDPVETALASPDNQPIFLQNVYVGQTIGNWAFVSDIMAESRVLPVYSRIRLQPFWSIDIAGHLRTVGANRTRVLIADEISLYITDRGTPSPPLVGDMFDDYPYMEQLSESVTETTGDMGALDEDPPVPPDPEPDPEPLVLSAPAGSIAAAKIDGGSVELTGKVVTGVYYQLDYSAIMFIYIQEPSCPTGIKVIPPSGITVNTRDVVSVSGTVGVDSATGECQITATSITKTGTAALPRAMGMPQRSTVG